MSDVRERRLGVVASREEVLTDWIRAADEFERRVAVSLVVDAKLMPDVLAVQVAVDPVRLDVCVRQCDLSVEPTVALERHVVAACVSQISSLTHGLRPVR